MEGEEYGSSLWDTPAFKVSAWGQKTEQPGHWGCVFSSVSFLELHCASQDNLTEETRRAREAASRSSQ
ncbi:unnamed protein product [Pleuronectes platessa]|uniref:Uncharacterized protein n=1 Tax=Pleuronectes platessa TaxID=8262 RepID=A0A9N7UY74_PLEPL|nr:unnamed protein product [Pleuronectes platessa]